MSLSLPPSPSFLQTPPEIIFQIIDTAGSLPDISLALSLARVASWVRARIDVHIYNTVVLSSRSKIGLFSQTVCARPASFFERHVRRLWIGSTDGRDLELTPENIHGIRSILTICPHVVDLTLDLSYFMDHGDLPCRPASLTVVSQFMFSLHLSSAVLEHLQNLCLVNGQLSVIPKVGQLPVLTHVTMCCCDHVGMGHALKSISAFLHSDGLRSIVVTPWQMPGPFPFFTEPSFRFAKELAALNDSRVIVRTKTINPYEQFMIWKACASETKPAIGWCQ